jgi:hypothetical protein
VYVNVAGEVAPDEDQVEWRLVVLGVEAGERLAVAFERHGVARERRAFNAPESSRNRKPEAVSEARSRPRRHLATVGHRLDGRLLDLDPARSARERRGSREHGKAGRKENKACECGATLLAAS